jgi:hypothetical protein
VHVDVVAHAGVGFGQLLVDAVAVVVALVLARGVVGQLVELQALVAHLLLVDRAGEAGEDGVPVAVRVVHRHVPLRDGHLRAHRDHEGLREHHVGHAHVGGVFAQLAQRLQAKAVVGGLHADVGAVVLAQHLGDGHVGVGRGAAELLAVAFGRVLVLEEAVQVRGVRGVDAHFERLQPVALEQALEGEGVAVGRDEAVEVGEGRGLALADVREHHAGLLDHRVGRLLDAAAQLAGGGLGRGLQAVALGVEQPAVEGAADAAVFQPAEGEVGAAVRAVAVEHAELAALVAEQDEVLPHELHRLDRARAGQLVGQGHRLPVAAQQLAGGGVGSDAGDEIVLLCADHCSRPIASDAP